MDKLNTNTDMEEVMSDYNMVSNMSIVLIVFEYDLLLIVLLQNSHLTSAVERCLKRQCDYNRFYTG